MWFQGGAVAPSSTCRRRRRCKGPGETASLRRSRLETQSETRWCDVGSKISSIPLAARAPRNKLGTHFAGGIPVFVIHLFQTHPSPGHKDWHAYHRSHCYPSTPGLAGAGGAGGKSGDRKSSVGRAKPGSSEAESSRNTQPQKWNWAEETLGSSPSAHLDATCTIPSTRWLTGASGGPTSELKPRQKQTQHDRRGARQRCIAALQHCRSRAIGARGFLDLGDLQQPGTPYRGSSELGPRPIGE